MKAKGRRHYWGVDCGSRAIKIALGDEQGRVLKMMRTKTLFPLGENVSKALRSLMPSVQPFKGERSELDEGHNVILTGYGRHHVAFATRSLTEIKSHFLGVQHQLKLSGDYELIDIGGQDSKVIHVRKGQVAHFDINRKCAAGTGAFIEELANRLDLDISKLGDLAVQSDHSLVLNSFCTVFAAQEALKLLMNGEKVENLIGALYESVAKRVLEMTPIESNRVVFSGGVMAHHPKLLPVFASRLPGKHLEVVPDAEFAGAIGAMRFGMIEDGMAG